MARQPTMSAVQSPSEELNYCIRGPLRRLVFIAFAQRDIDNHFAHRLHFLGNWHTHPQRVPSPSGTDLKNTQQRFIESEHALKAFVMVIVGLAPFPVGLYVALVDQAAVKPLSIVTPR